ncbi:VOC family protein [Robiginitalea sediminis]|uniref:VOC family protein n=1 Tax=Robiginitalea sediminis TaxID=1982593 RepID=UPI000B4AD8E2|nr:VOC family protein [Robiginitalea sediminis]
MKNNHIDYIEFPTLDIPAVKAFYSQCFGWSFTDYGPEYVSFENSGVTGGFRKTEGPVQDGVLIVLYHQDLEEILAQVKALGGKITQGIFSFPGGRRFHFRDPGGNELAVWSEDPEQSG